jgi:predicted metal-binding protein
MRSAPLAPLVHLFVCANRRPTDSPLGPGCGDGGEAVYSALKEAVARRGVVRDAWVTQTQCIGICPRQGCTVAIVARGDERIVAEVTPNDAGALLDGALAHRPDPLEVVERMERLQLEKVQDLARRLRPDLTPEDLRNPHDFPELEDPDWYYEDGVLTGIQSVASALRANKP